MRWPFRCFASSSSSSSSSGNVDLVGDADSQLPRQSPFVYRVGDPIYIIGYPGEDIWDVLRAVPAKRRDSRQDPRSVLRDAALQRAPRIADTGATLAVRLAAAQVTRVDFHVSPISSLASAIQMGATHNSLSARTCTDSRAHSLVVAQQRNPRLQQDVRQLAVRRHHAPARGHAVPVRQVHLQEEREKRQLVFHFLLLLLPLLSPTHIDLGLDRRLLCRSLLIKLRKVKFLVHVRHVLRPVQ